MFMMTGAKEREGGSVRHCGGGGFFSSGYMGIPGARFVTLKDTPLCEEELRGRDSFSRV